MKRPLRVLGTDKEDVHEIINFYFYNDLFPCRDGRISISLSFFCPGKVDESWFYIRPDELDANSISDIKSFKTSYHLFFDRRVKEANPGSFSAGKNPGIRLKHRHLGTERKIILFLKRARKNLNH